MNGADALQDVTDADFLAEAKRRADESPDFRDQLAKFVQGEVRPAVQGVLAGGSEPTPEGQPDLRQTLADQYAEWTKGTDGNKPTLEQVQASFSGEQLEVAGTYAAPYLLMMPVTDKDSGQITGYEPVIAEGGQEMDPYEGDDIYAKLEDRIPARKNARRAGESGMTRAVWDLLFLAVKKADKLIDVRFYAILEDDYSEGDPGVPFACLRNNGRPDFRRGPADYPINDARFRSTVRGNVLNI